MFVKLEAVASSKFKCSRIVGTSNIDVDQYSFKYGGWTRAVQGTVLYSVFSNDEGKMSVILGSKWVALNARPKLGDDVQLILEFACRYMERKVKTLAPLMHRYSSDIVWDRASSDLRRKILAGDTKALAKLQARNKKRESYLVELGDKLRGMWFRT